MKIFTAGLVTETNTFSSIPTGMHAFKKGFLVRRGEFGSNPHPYTLPLIEFKRLTQNFGGTVHEGLFAYARPAGPVRHSVYESLKAEIMDDLTKALPVDAVLLMLHGAMASTKCSDCEGDILSSVRKIVGSDVPIGAILDPHCHLSDTMIKNATAMICLKEYPHVDFIPRARELFNIIHRVVLGQLHPVMKVVDCHMIDMYFTSMPATKKILEHMYAIENQSPEILSVSLVHGFPWGDNPDLGTKVLVVTDNQPLRGIELAEEISQLVVDSRGSTKPDFLDLDDALDKAVQSPNKPVILADAADNAGGGAPSDSTFFLKRMIDRSLKNAAIGAIWDPGAVRMAFEAGEGARTHLRIGGKTGPRSGSPVDLEIEIVSLFENAWQSFGDGRSALGRVAVAKACGIDLLLSSLRTQVYHPDCFTNVGIEVKSKDIVVVKSAQHFFKGFSQIAGEIFYAAAPGALSPNPLLIPYKHVQRPLWPLVENPWDTNELSQLPL